jgi:alpha-1,6-mannosyltransferase
MVNVAENPTLGAVGHSVDPQTARRFTPAVVALLGAAGSILLALASNLPGSPFGPGAQGLWPLAGSGPAPGWEGPKLPTWVTLSNQTVGAAPGHVLPTVAVIAGVALLVLGWSLLWRRTRRHPELGPLTVWSIVGTWVAPLLFSAPFASQDVWTYGTEGHLVLGGVGGYRAAFLTKHSLWMLGVHGTGKGVGPSPYGPGALNLSALFVKISGGRPWVAAECWRVAAILALVLCGWGVTRVVALRGGNATAATLAGVANPGFLIVLVGGMHNDALMLGLMVGGVALAVSGKRSWGVALCVLGVSVKATALFALWVLSWWAWGSGWRDRIRGSAVAAAVAVGVLFVSGHDVGGGFGWINSALSSGSLPGPWSIGSRFFGIKSGLPVDAIALAGLALAVALVIRLGRSGRWYVGLGWGFAVLALTIPKPEPWYLAWALALLACGGLSRRVEQAGVLILIAMMTGSVLPLADVWWFGGVILLFWLGLVSARELRERMLAVSDSDQTMLDGEPSEDQAALLLSRFA